MFHSGAWAAIWVYRISPILLLPGSAFILYSDAPPLLDTNNLRGPLTNGLPGT